MKNTCIHLKKYRKNIGLVAIAAVLSISCDNQEVDVPGATESAEFIANLTGGNEKAWKIEKAILRNSSTVELDVTEEYTMKDDLFLISSSSNNTIDLKWEQGLIFKARATNVQEFNTDERASSVKQTLNYLGTDNAFRNSAANYYLEYDEVTEKISGTIFLSDDAKIDVVLSEKRAEDYLQAPQNLNAVSLLFELPQTSLWAGMKYSRANNTLFVNTPTLPWVTNNLEIRTAAFNTTTEVLTTNQFLETNDHPWTNLEAINDVVYNVGGAKIQTFDTSFGVPTSEFNIDIPGPGPIMLEYGSSSIDGDIYIFGGTLNSFDFSEIGVFRPGTQNTVEILTTLPSKMPFADGEIVGDILYIFGGHRGVGTGSNPNNFKYNLVTGELSSFEMPVSISFTSTAVVQNLIYVAGIRSIDNGIKSYVGVYNTITGTFAEIPLDFITNPEEYIYKVDATEDTIYMGFWNRVSGSDDDSFRVYASDL
jgi:hypothetical protein